MGVKNKKAAASQSGKAVRSGKRSVPSGGSVPPGDVGLLRHLFEALLPHGKTPAGDLIRLYKIYAIYNGVAIFLYNLITERRLSYQFAAALNLSLVIYVVSSEYPV